MRFQLGPISDHFQPDDTWLPIREPGPILAQFIALPLGVAMGTTVGYAWFRLLRHSQFPGFEF